ncbi:MAG: galactose-1-phosphate uridylyltransferase, partial [Chloroflexi bacterium]|nr:galactose-1-phosphate uridylyltransferase [Chloroflexota bacterium]
QPTIEQEHQARYLAQKGSCLLCDYAALEMARGERIVCENSAFIALVPFWAVWPFETMILSRRHTGSLADFSEAERLAFADILRRLTIRYDNLFEVSFPYTMGLHQRPTDGLPHPEWHFHVHFYPPLLRSATVKKFMVGYEMLANPQRDLTPESAASRLRALSEVRFA